MNIPFNNSEDLKRAMSGVDLKLDIENRAFEQGFAYSNIRDWVFAEVEIDVVSHFQVFAQHLQLCHVLRFVNFPGKAGFEQGAELWRKEFERFIGSTFGED